MNLLLYNLRYQPRSTLYLNINDYIPLLPMFLNSTLINCMTLDLTFYRYFKRELLVKNAIQKADLPPFMSTWLDRSSPDCMFSPGQFKSYTSPHLEACPWYLECNFGFIPPEEEILFNTLKESALIVSGVDEFAGLDPEARDKAIAKREAADKKKEDRWMEARNKTQELEKKKAVAKAGKEQEKGKKKGSKRKAETPVQEPTTSVADMPDTSSGFSLTQERLVHGLTPTTANLSPVPNIDECILNLSLATLPNNQKAFDSVLAFLEMVMIYSLYSCLQA